MTSRRSQDRRRNNSKAVGRRQHGGDRAATPGSNTTASAVNPEDGFQRDWADSRRGAGAARGFHFQDAVGAWLAAQVSDAALDGVLVPEGLDDMALECANAVNIQIKSRVTRLGAFPLGLAAKHIVDTWSANQGRSNPAEQVWVVLENGVRSGEPFRDAGQVLRDVLAADAPLRIALAQASAGELSADDLDHLLTNTVVLAPTWSDLDEWTDERLANMTSVQRGGRDIIARSLRTEIATATDTNEHPDSTRRVRLDRTTIMNHINAIAEQLDVEGLESALRDGLCVALDWHLRAREGDRFYEGVATQPGHVSSGLVVPRDDLLVDVLLAVEADQPVVITGPSGIGKSALLWTVPQALPGVTWFRVQRLQNASDANQILRLARACGASEAHPVGFLIDGAGAGQLTGWGSLRSHASTQSGVLLVATARNEDLVDLGELAGTATVAVTLDERSAAAIFDGLRRSEATALPHWREAFEQSNGLTLEYTYLLTQGRRLHDVIADQVQSRITDRRHTELELLALVAVAGQWSTTLQLDQVAETTGAATFDLRTDIQHLADEHLLVEVDGVLSGLHPVRSAAIADAIHGTPPPTLASTFTRVLQLVDDSQLPRFLGQALREHPELVDVALAAAAEPPLTASRLTAYLQGLRLADTEAVIRQWITIMDEETVNPSIRQSVAMFAIAKIDLGDLTPPALKRALRRMDAVRPRGLRDQLADRVGPDVISTLVFDSDPTTARALIAPLAGWPQPLERLPSAHSSTLVQQLKGAELATLAETLATLEAHDRELWIYVVEQLGGEDGMLRVVRRQCPWILDLSIQAGDEGPVGFARLLQVDDERQGNPRDRCVALARILLRLLPSIDKTDIEALLPGRLSLEIGGHVFGTSGLVRRYNHSDTDVAWNQMRIATARALLGTPDTIRLSLAYPVLRDTAQYLREIGNRWVRGELTPARVRPLTQTAARLERSASQLTPALGRRDIEPTIISPGSAPTTTDPLSTLITNCASLLGQLQNESDQPWVRSFVGEHVLRQAKACLDEPWYLIDEGDQALDCLRQIMSDCRDLDVVLGLLQSTSTAASQIRDAARKVSVHHSLHHCGQEARQLRSASFGARRTEIATAVAAITGDAVDVLTEEREGLVHHAVLVPVPTLFRWYELQSDIVEALQQLKQGGEQFLILPLRNGRRVEGHGVSLILSPLPVVDVGEWQSLLPAAHPAELGLLVSEAIRELSVMSGLTELTPDQLQHPDVVALGRQAGESLAHTVRRLFDHPDDFTAKLLDEFGKIAARLQEEEQGTAEEPTFAAAVALAATGQFTNEAEIVGLMKVCAIEWEINPGVVRDLLDSGA